MTVVGVALSTSSLTAGYVSRAYPRLASKMALLSFVFVRYEYSTGQYFLTLPLIPYIKHMPSTAAYTAGAFLGHWTWAGNFLPAGRHGVVCVSA